MKKLSLVLALVLFGLGSMLAQRTVSGNVTDDSGDALIGASVLVKGTTTGTVTDLDGNFSVTVPSDASVLVISYTGFSPEEIDVAGMSTVNITLQEGTILDEIVVTALGVEREKKSLGYATQEIDGDAVTTAKTDNFIASLSGRLAGVQVRSNNNFGGSADIIIRGHTSLTGNNQPLFVVDGVPLDNANENTSKQRNGRRGYDFGNAATDINPEDIESINILKGAAATALYGARAANGAVIVTTKKGGGRQGLGISISSGVTFGQIDRTTFAEYQDEYGAGYGPYYPSEDGYFLLEDVDGDGTDDLVVPLTEDASYGAPFDPNLMVYQWDAFVPESDNYLKARPYVAAANTPVEFFERSVTFNNSIALSGANDQGSFRLAYTNYNTEGVLPNSNLDRHTVSFNSGYSITDNLTATVGANVVTHDAVGRNSTGYSDNLMTQFRQWWQVNVDIKEQEDIYNLTGKNYTWNPSGPFTPETPIYWDNPYWTRWENYSSDGRTRLFGNLALSYDFNDWLNLMGRVSMDTYSELREERRAVGSTPTEFAINTTSSVSDVGSGYRRLDREFTEYNYDVILTANKYLSDDFSLLAFVGMNIRRSTLETVDAVTNGGLASAGFYSLSNSAGPVSPAREVYERRGINGLFGSVSLGYRNFLYLDITGRRDVSSTLPEENNAYFYPSASMSLVFSELMNAEAISFGKLRLNYAEVGNDAPVQSIFDTYDKLDNFGNTPLFSVNRTKNNEDLRPERTTSIEAGLEMNFFQNRIGFDLGVYQTNTIDQILPVAVSRSTGYSFKFVNSGEVENKGIEVALFGSPVKTTDFEWTIFVNWSRNRNEVLSLFDGVDNLQLGSFQGGVTINATVGEPYGTIRGTGLLRDDNGNPVIAESGFYSLETDQVIGNLNPDWTGGIGNSIRYQGLELFFLVDVREGGNVFSLDQHYGYGTGLYPETAGLNDLGNPTRDDVADGGGILLDGVDENGADNTTYGRADYYGGIYYWGRGNERYAYDASYVKLREVSLGYTFPNRLTESWASNVSLTLVGRNLWIISKETPYSDPEDGLSSGNLQGYQAGSFPSIRTFGVKLNLDF